MESWLLQGTMKYSAVFLLLLSVTSHIVFASTSSDANKPTTTVSSSSRLQKGVAFYPRGRDRPHNYEIINEEVHYSGWRKVIRRSVNTNTNNSNNNNSDDNSNTTIHFDIIDQAHSNSGAVIIFAWNSTSLTATIVREYMPGPHRVLSGLAAGIVEEGKHSSKEGDNMNEEDTALIAARYELEEEW